MLKYIFSKTKKETDDGHKNSEKNRGLRVKNPTLDQECPTEIKCKYF